MGSESWQDWISAFIEEAGPTLANQESHTYRVVLHACVLLSAVNLASWQALPALPCPGNVHPSCRLPPRAQEGLAVAETLTGQSWVPRD